MVFEPIESNETEAAASEAEFLNRIGALANGINAHRNKQNNPTGCCLECKKAIPPERLEIFPNSNYCVRCQGEMDKKSPRATPYRNTIPLSMVFKDENESEGDKDKESDDSGNTNDGLDNTNEGEKDKDRIEMGDLPADLGHAIKVHQRDAQNI